MSAYEVTIRLMEEERAFAYTVRERDRVVASGRVETEDAVAPGYYGGSEAMD
jgi:hypothetical protein